MILKNLFIQEASKYLADLLAAVQDQEERDEWTQK